MTHAASGAFGPPKNDADLHFRSLYGDKFRESLDIWRSTNPGQRLTHWEGRYINPEVFPIEYATYIYDDVVAYLNWRDNEIYGIEIYNKEIANAQRQVFDMLFEKAGENL